MEKPKTCAYRSEKKNMTLEKITHELKSQNIYVSMACMYTNAESTGIGYGVSSQLTNWILDSCATCHTTPEISDFMAGSLAETDKYIKVVDGNFVTAKKTV